MNQQDLPILSRSSLEQAFAGVLFAATTALVAGGVLAMVLHTAFAA